MTRSKQELATILIKLRGEITDEKKIEKEAKKLGDEMSLMKLCYEIQKVEEKTEDELTQKEQKVVEELTVPVKVTKERRNKHILSWLLDSSSDEDAA